VLAVTAVAVAYLTSAGDLTTEPSPPAQAALTAQSEADSGVPEPAAPRQSARLEKAQPDKAQPEKAQPEKAQPKRPQQSKQPGQTKGTNGRKGSRKATIAHRGPASYVRADVAREPASGRTPGSRVLRFDVRVEKGLPFDAEAVARFMHGVLNDRRSWTGGGSWRFELVRSPQRADVHAYVATPRTTDRLCAPLRTRGKVSCQNGKSVVLNARRWAYGASAYGDGLVGYRTYLVNHEFGHVLGHQHVGCPGKGRRAPVMMQQTKGVAACRPNPWPAPGRR
jgi:hypothetical protein